ncbi:hypothetical protein EMCRGX_G033165 [Ephydatia muelleri]|eukprot:Em0034g22a
MADRQQPSSSQQQLQQPSSSHGTCAPTLSVDNAGNIEGIFWNEEYKVLKQRRGEWMMERPCTTVSLNDGEELVQQLKEKFNSTTRSERLRILTILPKSWSRRKVAKVFGVSRRLNFSILAGAAGTHSVCVCTIHQNIKLMMAGGKIESLTDGLYKHYRHCLAAMHCNPPNIDCHFGNCNQCTGTEPLHKSLQAAFDKHSIDTVEFKQWTSTDRATLETRVLQVDEFVDCFNTMMKKLVVHDFTAKMQSSFMQQKKESLNEGEFLVIADFSENFSFVVQDEVQSFHWNNSSATVHPFVCYYREKENLKSLCYIIISENTA